MARPIRSSEISINFVSDAIERTERELEYAIMVGDEDMIATLENSLAHTRGQRSLVIAGQHEHQALA